MSRLFSLSFQAEFDEEHIFIADASEMVLLHNKQIKPPTNIMTRGNRIMTVDLGGMFGCQVEELSFDFYSTSSRFTLVHTKIISHIY